MYKYVTHGNFISFYQKMILKSLRFICFDDYSLPQNYEIIANATTVNNNGQFNCNMTEICAPILRLVQSTTKSIDKSNTFNFIKMKI
jgi:hypothetical protein